jgi:hypothetical protein
MDNFNHTESQPFYNTINLTPEQWKEENEKAAGLQAKIEVIYKANPAKKFSSWQMQELLTGLLGKKVNINSVRRSITNLKNDGVLLKTDTMRTGQEGKNEHLYALKSATSMPSDSIAYKKGQETAADIAKKLIVPHGNAKQGEIFGD